MDAVSSREDQRHRVKSYFPIPICFKRFKELANISPVVWDRSRHHNGVGPSGVGKAQPAKASSMVLVLFLLLHRHG